MRRDEFDFIEQIRRRALKKHSFGGLLLGIGDDAAIVRHDRDSDFLVTADLLVEDVDFRRAYSPPRLLGHKALAVSLSDIAAMGARPRFCLLSVGVPRKVWRTKFLDEFYEGFFALAEKYKVALIGGDISQTPERIVIDSIVTGEVKRNRAVRRSGAKAGDIIFVTGALGGAAAGLHLLESGARYFLNRKSLKRKSTKIDACRNLMLRQLAPEPRTAWGEFLGRERLASAMIDLSDGLSSDLAHLCRASGVGARINAELISIDARISNLRHEDFNSDDALELALHGGEDYELIFTARPRALSRLPNAINRVPITRIGEITNQEGRIELIQNSRVKLLKPRGFKHFRRAK
jgi:thiamine-monophosphate kinase